MTVPVLSLSLSLSLTHTHTHTHTLPCLSQPRRANDGNVSLSDIHQFRYTGAIASKHGTGIVLGPGLAQLDVINSTGQPFWGRH